VLLISQNVHGFFCLSPSCLSVVSMTISALLVSGALGACAITLIIIHNYTAIKAAAAALQCL
jgi:hypothetical protein